MKSKIKVFLKKFQVKESVNVKLWGHKTFDYGWVGVLLPHESKIDQISTYQSPPTNFLDPPIKALSPLLLLEMGNYSLKTEKGH